MDPSTRTGGSERRGDPRYILVLSLVLIAAGTAIQLAFGSDSIQRAVLTASVLAIPFSIYAWYEGGSW